MNFLKLLLLSFSLAFHFTANAQSPNILLIIADDLGIDAINGYGIGLEHPNTPHLDSLRNNGVNFTNAWSSPVCTPTRAGIMSGKYGSKNGVKTAPGNLDTTHISLLKAIKFANPNYTTAVTGKWHIAKPAKEMHPIWHGADHYMGVLAGAVPFYDNWDKTENDTTVASTDYVTSYFTDDAISWIGNQNNPWFMWLAHIAPHTPLHIPPVNMYTQPSTNSQLKKYMAMIESLDYEVGRLLDALSPAEKANTTIIFIGDNGTANNVLQDYPANHGKESLYEGGIHVPLFVCGNGVTRIGETENALVNVIDIYATAVELAGTDLPGGIYNSLSFKHLLTSSSLPKRKYNFSELDTNATEINVQGYTIRDSVYKLIEYHTGVQEMFNLKLDTLETNDLLLGTLSVEEQAIKLELENEAEIRRTGWSCNDGILNGDEVEIDQGGTYCALNSTNHLATNSKFLIYPNPAQDVLTIETNEPVEVKIMDLKGQIIETINIDNGIHTISLKQYASGLYFVQALAGNERVVEMLNVGQ